MKSLSNIILLAFLFICITITVQAQEVTLPEYTTHQRWDRAESILNAYILFAIRYGQLMDQDIEDVADALAEVFGPGWSEDLTPPQMLRHLHRNWMAYKDAEFEVIEASEGKFRAHLNRPYLDYFGNKGERYGTSVEDYEMFIGLFFKQIAAKNGMVYEQQVVETETMVITVRKR